MLVTHQGQELINPLASVGWYDPLDPGGLDGLGNSVTGTAHVYWKHNFFKSVKQTC